MYAMPSLPNMSKGPTHAGFYVCLVKVHFVSWWLSLILKPSKTGALGWCSGLDWPPTHSLFLMNIALVYPTTLCHGFLFPAVTHFRLSCLCLSRLSWGDRLPYSQRSLHVWWVSHCQLQTLPWGSPVESRDATPLRMTLVNAHSVATKRLLNKSSSLRIETFWPKPGRGKWNRPPSSSCAQRITFLSACRGFQGTVVEASSLLLNFRLIKVGQIPFITDYFKWPSTRPNSSFLMNVMILFVARFQAVELLLWDFNVHADDPSDNLAPTFNLSQHSRTCFLLGLYSLLLLLISDHNNCDQYDFSFSLDTALIF